MMKTIDDIEAMLEPYINVATKTFRKGITTDRTLALAKHVGSPHERLRVVHVAGTSGKTSTSYFMRSMLEAAGKKTGLTVSPHVMGITERVQVSGQPLSDKTFVRYMNEFFDYIVSAPETPTYFEILIVFALWVFDKEGVDYAVIETGLGGLHDSSNICRREDKLCIITDIGYDHMHVLGNTLADIAAQKCGIIASGNTVVMYKQSSVVMTVAKKAANTMNADLHVIEPTTNHLYQQRNWRLAYQAYELLRNRDHLPELSKESQQQTQSSVVPGRMDVYTVGTKTVLLDGAHNEQKMDAFWQSFEHKYSGVKPLVIFGIKNGKDIQAVIPHITAHARRIITTKAHATQDLGLGLGMEANDVADAVYKQSGIVCDVVPHSHDAIRHALQQDEAMIVVTGSLYLVAEIRTILNTNML